MYNVQVSNEYVTVKQNHSIRTVQYYIFQQEEFSMAELKGSKTEQNLWEAFAGESKARNKYTYYASKAKKRRLCADRRAV